MLRRINIILGILKLIYYLFKNVYVKIFIKLINNIFIV